MVINGYYWCYRFKYIYFDYIWVLLVLQTQIYSYVKKYPQKRSYMFCEHTKLKCTITIMQSDQFFQQTPVTSKHKMEINLQSTEKAGTSSKDTEIDYDNFHFEAYFDRCIDINNDNEDESAPCEIIRKLSREITNQPIQNQHYNYIVKEGFLDRQSQGLISKSERRYCVLTNKQLFCFQDQHKQNLLSCINICLLPCSVSQQYELIKIYYCVKNKPIVLKGKSIDVSLEWYQEINKVIYRHLNTKKIYLKKGISSIYSEKNILSEGQFLREAQTGDILVMKTKQNSSCFLQRLVTNSQYDHVSLIVRLENNQIQIFESNANEGVVLLGWKQYHCRYNCYQRIAYRKLIYEQREKLQDHLLNFAKSTLGKEYDIGAIKLIKQWSSQDKSKRSYFCSELVAKAYKMMGLVDKQKASARYWPVDFTERGGLQLLDGAALGRQKIIVLQQHISKYE